nr:TIGR00730 family Rossman fold protein [Nesterenkonia sp. Act20]
MTVFTGSASGTDPEYTTETRELGSALAAVGISVVYGGAMVGLMGHLADAALGAGGEVHGVIPEVLMDREVAHQGLTSLELVPDMHTRKSRMAELGDGFIALPGGMGTLEEFFEVWTWQYLGLHAKPVGLYNVKGFWDPLLRMVEHMVAEGFMSPARRDALVISADPQDLITALRAWTPAI